MGPVCSAHGAQGFNGHPYTDLQAHSLARSPLLHSRLTSATSPPEGLTRNLNTRNIKFSGWMNMPRPTPYTLLSLDGSPKQAALSLFLMYFQQDTWEIQYLPVLALIPYHTFWFMYLPSHLEHGHYVGKTIF